MIRYEYSIISCLFGKGQVLSLWVCLGRPSWAPLSAPGAPSRGTQVFLFREIPSSCSFSAPGAPSRGAQMYFLREIPASCSFSAPGALSRGTQVYLLQRFTASCSFSAPGAPSRGTGMSRGTGSCASHRPLQQGKADIRNSLRHLPQFKKYATCRSSKKC